MGRPDVLVNSAGILHESRFEDESLAVFREIMDVNFFGTVHCVQAVLPFFGERGGGRIVNVCSVAGLMTAYGYSAYCASKHAVAGLTHALRQELRPRGVQVHLVCPGEFESPMVDKLNAYRSPENRAHAQMIPVLSAAAVADAVMKGLERGRYMIVPGAATRLVERLNRYWPGAARAFTDLRLSAVRRKSSGRRA